MNEELEEWNRLRLLAEYAEQAGWSEDEMGYRGACADGRPALLLPRRIAELERLESRLPGQLETVEGEDDFHYYVLRLRAPAV